MQNNKNSNWKKEFGISLPWTDIKYKKRADSLLFFIIHKLRQLSNDEDKQHFNNLLDIFIGMKNTITQISTKPEIFDVNQDNFRSYIPKLLKFIKNKEEYNFFNITDKYKYKYNNLASNYFNCYSLNTTPNFFEKSINFILTWSCIIMNDEDEHHNTINNTVRKPISNSARINLIKNIYTGNGIYIDIIKKGIDVFYYSIVQHYLDYIWNLGSKAELLKPLLNP